MRTFGEKKKIQNNADYYLVNISITEETSACKNPDVLQIDSDASKPLGCQQNYS